MKLFKITAVLALALAPAFGKGYLSALETNKKVVFDFYRLVFEPRNADLAPKPPMKRGGAEESASIDYGREGDLVTYVFKQVVGDPKDKSKTYERFSFDTFRVKGGKIVEHWDGASRW